MAEKLRIADDLELPLEIVTQKIAYLGRTGGGKTYAATKTAELMLDAGAQIVYLDPVGKAYGLRIAADGGEGFPIPVIGGMYGDVPLEPTAGSLIADLIVDREISAVLDVSQMISAEQTRFALAFARRLFQRRKAEPAAMHLFIEECQEFVPQNLPPSEKGEGNAKMMLHEFERLIKLGRNYGIGASLISQRPQEVNKKVLNMTEIMFVFQMTGPQERAAIRDWVRSKGEDDSIVETLPTLEVGHAHVWSPVFLKVNRVVKIAKKKTADVSATPKVGERVVVPRALSPVDVEKIKTAMAETIEKAKAEDPKELRRQIGELQKQLRERPQSEPVTIEVPVLSEDHAARLEASVDNLQAMAKDLNGLAEELRAELRRAQQKPEPPRRVVHDPAPRPIVIDRTERPTIKPSSDSGVTAPEQRILNAIARLESLGVGAPNNSVVAVLSGYAMSGTFRTYLGAMRNQKGLIEYPDAGHVALTESGRALAEVPESPPTLAELQSAWMDLLDGPGRKIIQEVIRAYPDSVSHEELAERTGYTVSGTFRTYLGALRNRYGVISYPAPGYVRATELLFPEGLR